MNGTRRMAWVGLAVAASAAGLTWGAFSMGWFSSDDSALKRLLGPGGQALLQGAQVAPWVPDPDHQALAWYLVRPMAAEDWQALAKQAGFAPEPVPAGPASRWALPAGVTLAGWEPDRAASGGGQQAQAALGQAMAWLRWHQGTLWAVLQRSGP
jgi:hypothetical protein